MKTFNGLPERTNYNHGRKRLAQNMRKIVPNMHEIVMQVNKSWPCNYIKNGNKNTIYISFNNIMLQCV